MALVIADVLNTAELAALAADQPALEFAAGRALVIEDMLEARKIKLKAGDLILYPSTILHRVSAITKGERIAIVGCVRYLGQDPI